jgi:hypothetical protein
MMTIRTREDLREQRKNERIEAWDKLFTDHVYMVLNRINPGMKLGSDAVQFISKILILVLHEFVEEVPESVTAVQTIIKKLFPSTWGTFVVKVKFFKLFLLVFIDGKFFRTLIPNLKPILNDHGFEEKKQNQRKQNVWRY